MEYWGNIMDVIVRKTFFTVSPHTTYLKEIKDPTHMDLYQNIVVIFLI